MATAKIFLSRAMFDAVIFDTDGVVTQTAKVHAAAWKEMFDEFLQDYAERSGKTFEPFDIDEDYPRYVDGKPRHDGVRDFLFSRGIELSKGIPDAPPRGKPSVAWAIEKTAAFAKCWLSGAPSVMKVL